MTEHDRNKVACESCNLLTQHVENQSQSKKVWSIERMYLGKCLGKSSVLVNSSNNDVKVLLPLNSTSSQMTATSKV